MTDSNSDNVQISAPQSPASDDDAASDTSTLVYSHESFKEYRARVEEIAQKTWPGLQKEHILIERMHGGSYNRITGISIWRFETQKSEEYVLRDPRFVDLAPLTDHLAPLQFLYENSKLPVPRLVTFDCSSDNALAKPYIIQQRAPGNPALYEYSGMSHQGRLAIARQLGLFYNNLTSITGNRIGKLVPSNTDLTASWTFDIQTFIRKVFKTVLLRSEPHNIVSEPDAAYTNLMQIFKYRHDADLANPLDFRAPYDSSFISMTEELHTLGCLTDVPITLCHLDLEVYNILIDPNNNTEPVSAVLDWDSAVFAPVFMACTPPMWLWAWKEGEDEEERQANETPTTAENQELKCAFEEMAGPTYTRFAYNPVYRLARRLVQFALFGMHSAEQQDEAEEMLKEWSEIKPQSM